MPNKSFWPQNRYRVTLLFLLFFKFVGFATISLKNRRALKKNCSENLVFFTDSKLGVFYNFIFLPTIYNAEYAFMTIVTRIIEISQAVWVALQFFDFTLLLYK